MINYETEIKQRRADGKSAATIAGEINADRRASSANYRPIESVEYGNWMGAAGRRKRISREVNSFEDDDSIPQEDRDEISGAWETLVSLSVHPSSTLRVAPGEDHRLLIELGISSGLMEQSDLDALDDIAYTGVDETAETVQATIDDHDQSIVQSNFENELASAQLAAHASISSGGTLADAWAAFDASRGA